jgi:hypothetical protein
MRAFKWSKVFHRGAVWFCALGHLACGGEDDTTSRVLENSGTLCLEPAGASILAHVEIGECLRGRCAYLGIPPRCQASFEGGAVVVTSRAEILSDTSPGLNCPDECRVAKAVCQLTGPSDPSEGFEGEVPVLYGARQAMVRLPLGRAAPLFGATGASCTAEK